MKVVLDASAALRAALAEQSRPPIVDILSAASNVITTDFFIAEVTSGLWKYVVRREFSIEVALGRLEFAMTLPTEYRGLAELAEDALREAAARRHSVYDLYYAVLARREGAAILTFDGRLKELCAAMGIPTLLS